MAVDILSVPSPVETITKLSATSVTTQRHISHTTIPQPQNSTECGVPCPYCAQLGQNGVCGLAAKHPGNHQCNLNSSHQWSGTGIPGPHP
jgi:hypothetical protein